MNITDGKRIVIYDLETDGFVPGVNEPIQVATMTIQGDDVKRESWFVRYPGTLPDRIRELTGITDQDVHSEDALTLHQSAARLWDIICPPDPNLILVGHNIIRFDNMFVEHAWQQQIGIVHPLESQSYDTLPWTRVDRHLLHVPQDRGLAWQKSILLRRISGGPKCDLKSACEHYGVVQDGFHQAHNDVEACWAIMQKQLAIPRPALAVWLEDSVSLDGGIPG